MDKLNHIKAFFNKVLSIENPRLSFLALVGCLLAPIWFVFIFAFIARILFFIIQILIGIIPYGLLNLIVIILWLIFIVGNIFWFYMTVVIFYRYNYDELNKSTTNKLRAIVLAIFYIYIAFLFGIWAGWAGLTMGEWSLNLMGFKND